MMDGNLRKLLVGLYLYQLQSSINANNILSGIQHFYSCFVCSLPALTVTMEIQQGNVVFIRWIKQRETLIFI